MPPKRVPGLAYADVRAYWKKYGCSPGPVYPISDSIAFDFSNEMGFIPSPCLVTLKVLLHHIDAELLVIRAEQDERDSNMPALDLNLVHTIGLMQAWDVYNAQKVALDQRFNALFDSRYNAQMAWYAQHQLEWNAHLDRLYPHRLIK